MKVPKFFFDTTDVLKDKLATKMRLREELATKVNTYDVAIRELKEEIQKRDELQSGAKQ